MNESGQVNIELRLLLEQVKRDAKAAADIIKAALGGSSDAVASSTARATRQQGELEQQVRRTTRALREQRDAALAEWRRGLPAPQIRGVGFDAPRSGSGGNPLGSWSTTAGGGLATNPAGMFGGGGGTPRGPANAAAGAAASIQSALSSPLAIAAQFGAALAGLNVIVRGVTYVFEKLMIPLRIIVATADAARRQYASSLSQGLGTGYGVATGALASAIGVGQNEVMQYAQVVEILNGKMRFSIKTFQETNQTLTYTSYTVKSLQASWSAVWAVISAELSPGLNHLASVMRDAADAAARSGLLKFFAELANALLHFIAVQTGLASMITQAWGLITQTMTDGIEYFARQVRNSIARMTGGSIDASDPFKESKAMASVLAQTFKDTFMRPRNQQAPEAIGSSNRLAASAWERMGLVIGASPAMDIARQQLQELRRQTKLLETISGSTPRSGQYGSSALASVL